MLTNNFNFRVDLGTAYEEFSIFLRLITKHSFIIRYWCKSFKKELLT